MAAEEQKWTWPGSKPTPEWQVFTGPGSPTHVFYSPEEVRAYLRAFDLGKGWEPETGIQEFHVRIHKVVRHDEPHISIRTMFTGEQKAEGEAPAKPATKKPKKKSSRKR